MRLDRAQQSDNAVHKRPKLTTILASFLVLANSRKMSELLIWIACSLGAFNAAELPKQDTQWEPIFNGKDLSGWYGIATMGPRKMQSMPASELSALKEKHREATVKHWTVENGELVNDGGGPYLTTAKDYRDYELKLEYKTVAKADSGIYLKATPQVQIWDFTEAGGKWNIGADKGSGGLWNNSKGAAGKDPLVLADHPFGQWNHIRIRQVGSRTSVWLNEKLVVDHAIMENFWDRKRPLVNSGPIQLQTHGGEIRWRDIKIREIDGDEANKILAAGTNRDYQSVFNGKDLSGWTGATDNYQVENGIIMCRPGKGGNLITEKQYADFAVRFEFKLPPKGNNGLAIRYPGKGDPAYVGMCELQILAADYPGKLDDRQAHGSAYGMVAAEKGYLRQNGEWNFQEVTVVGSTIKVELNGSVILDTDLSKVSKYMDNRPHPGKDGESGHFGFAGHNDPVEFRQIAIRELQSKEPSSPK